MEKQQAYCESTSCPHPAKRLYSGLAYNCITDKKDWLWIGCADCGEILKRGDEEFEQYLAQHKG